MEKFYVDSYQPVNVGDRVLFSFNTIKEKATVVDVDHIINSCVYIVLDDISKTGATWDRHPKYKEAFVSDFDYLTLLESAEPEEPNFHISDDSLISLLGGVI